MILMTQNHVFIAGVVLSCLAVGVGRADDKSNYNLFNPMPESDLRPFNSDRPDVTESPQTIDAGHYQLEFSFVEYTYDDHQGVRSDGFSVLPSNLRVGVLNNLEMDLMVNPYQNILTHGQSQTDRASGYGDMEVRGKLNLWGNDGSVTAGGILPFVVIPTGADEISDHHLEGGVILPLSVNLPFDFSLGTQAEFDVNRNDDNSGYGCDFVHTITVEHDLMDRVSAYVEYVGESPMHLDQSYLAFGNFGLLFLIAPNLQLDCGINCGISRQAPDYTVFSGLSLRI